MEEYRYKNKCIKCGREWLCIPTRFCYTKFAVDSKVNPDYCNHKCIKCIVEQFNPTVSEMPKLVKGNCYKLEEDKYKVALII